MKRSLTISSGAVLSGQPAEARAFRDGETVCFLGDSITHVGAFHRFVYDYYLTRFPERAVRFVNAGIAGDSAGGAMGRLAEDVIDKRPTAVAVMFGMNDVNRGAYVAAPNPQQKAAQQGALDTYRKNMEILAGRLRHEAGEPRLLFVTPSPFDETGVNDLNNNQPGCNDGLGRCARIVRTLAAEHHAAVVDLHGPMTAFNAERQASDPTFTIVGPDRVHPGMPGHLMMAWLFLKAQAVPVLVSRIAIDAAAGRVTESANATVSQLTQRDGAWTFTALEKALPFPIDDAAKAALEWLPIEEDLNRETLSVTGLSDGQYELVIDGTPVARHSAAAWAQGVNLACNAATPQHRQAQAVAGLNQARHATEGVLRNYAAVRWFLGHCQVNPDDLAAVKVFAETKMNKTGYLEGMVPLYLSNWSTRREVIAKAADLEQQCLAARHPVAHTYLLRRDAEPGQRNGQGFFNRWLVRVS